MPSDDQASLTAHPRALDLFTDRVGERRRFAHYLHAQPPAPRPIFFHGDGGNGKSLLLKHLRAEFCRLLPPDQWAHCDAQPDTRAGDHACLDAYRALVGADDAGNSIKVPCIWHDFAASGACEGNPQDAWPALLMLRKHLTKFGFKLPTFDYAVTRWLHATDRLSADQLKQLLPVEELDALGATVDYMTSTQSPTLNLLARGLEVVAKNWKGNLKLLLAQRGIDAATRKRLNALFDTDRDPSALDNALDALPRLFANDLNAWMQRPGTIPRLVLFFDTHEAFWGSDREQSRSRQSYFDEDAWLRRLINGLYPSSETNRGIVVVIAGREPPRWAEAVTDKIEDKRIDCQLVGHWGRADARDYLCRALDPANFTNPDDDCGPLVPASAADQPNPAQDEALIEAMISSAEVAEDQVHPLFLGLAADIFCLANKRGQRLTAAAFAVAPEHTDHRAAMVERLLRYCPEAVAHAVKALAAARSFDEALFYALGKRLHFRHERPDFETLTRFSFCWTSPERDRYRIHDLLRRLLAEQDAERMQQAHAALEAIYRERGQSEPVAIAEAIYHANRQDWERGAAEWVETIEPAIRNARWVLAEALAEVRPVLRLESDFDRGLLTDLIAELAVRLSRHQAAQAAYQDAIAAYDRVLTRMPEDVGAHINKAGALIGLGELCKALSDYTGAQATFQNAIAACDQALAREPDHSAAHGNKGKALMGLGDLRTDLSDHLGAQTAYQAATAAYDQALARTPEDIAIHNSNKGLALVGLGDLRLALGDYLASQVAYQEAIAAYDQALARAPEDVYAHNNKGLALLGAGDLSTAMSDHAGAQAAYLDAISAYDWVLARAPELVEAQHNRGIALAQLGKLHASLGDHPEAEAAYQAGIAAFDQALAQAPEYVYSHSSKALTLSHLGDLRVALTDEAGAQAAYQDAIAAFDQALARAPKDVGANCNKGDTLRRFGDLHMALSDHARAEAAYQAAITAYDRALAQAPEDVGAHCNKGLALKGVGDLRAALSDHAGAQAAYFDSIAAYDRALALAPDHVGVHYNKGHALQDLGYLSVALSDHKGAQAAYQDAIAAYDLALAGAPEAIVGLREKSRCLTAMARLTATLGDPETGRKHLREAEALVQRGLARSAGELWLLAEAEDVQALLAEFGCAETRPET